MAIAAASFSRSSAESYTLLLAPLAPHLAEELWRRLGHDASLAYHAWPTWDESLLEESTIEVVIQVNGKLRGRIEVPANADRQTVESAALDVLKVANAMVAQGAV